MAAHTSVIRPVTLGPFTMTRRLAQPYGYRAPPIFDWRTRHNFCILQQQDQIANALDIDAGRFLS